MFEPTPDFSPDLEWMLRSGQVSEALIVETLVNEYYEPIYRLALSMLDDPASPHQVTQDSFVSIVKNAHRYRTQDSVQTWLYQSAIRTCRRQLLEVKAQRAFQSVLSSPKVEGPYPDSVAEAQVWLAVDRLPLIDRLLISLHSVQNLPLPEIAEILRKPEAALHARLEQLHGRLQVETEAAGEEAAHVSWEAALQKRWPACCLLEDERRHTSAEIQSRINLKGVRRLQALRPHELVMIGGIVLVLLLLTGIGNRLLSDRLPASGTALVTSLVEKVASAAGLDEESGRSAKAKETAGSRQQKPEEAATEEVGKYAPSDLSIPAAHHLELSSVPGISGSALTSEHSGPTSLAGALAYWNWNGSLEEVIEQLQPNPGDVNVMPYELISYVEEETNLKAFFRVGLTKDMLQHLTAAGFPVIIQRSLIDPESREWKGGYALVSGYDQTGNSVTILSADSGQWEERLFSYGQLNRSWQAFNYMALLVFRPEDEGQLFEVLGQHAGAAENFRQAAQRASDEIYSSAGLARFFAWFNRATSLAFLDDYSGAASAYDQAFTLYQELSVQERPQRILWYQSRPYWAYFYTGRYEDVIRLAELTLLESGGAVVEESYYWRGLAREALGDVEGAVADLKESLNLNPNFLAGQHQLNRIKRGS